MANFDPTDVTGYPFGSQDPLSSAAVNKLAENQAKTINAAEGSSHAPSADIELSGSGGGGFKFDTGDPVPFYGTLDLLGGLLCSSSGGPATGACTFNANVAVTCANLTLSGTTTVNSATTTTFNGTASCTFGSSTTLNLSGASLVRGTLTIKSSGGPGAFVLESGCAATLDGTTALNGNTAVGASCVITFANGSALAGGTLNSTCVLNQSGNMTLSGRLTRTGVLARTVHRPYATLSGSANADVTVEQDRYRVPQTLTGNRVYTVRHTGTVPVAGERIRVFRTGTSTPSSHTAKFERENNTIIWSFYIGYQGFAVFEYTGSEWDCVEGNQQLSGTSGFYDDQW